MMKEKYFKTGVDGLDAMMTRGVPAGSAVLIEGGPGCGKTIMALQACVSACKRGTKTLFMSFEEPEYRLREHLREFSFSPEEYERKGILRIKRFNALDIARSVEALLSEAKKELLIEIQPVLIPEDFQPELVFVDSLTSISSAFSGEESRFRIYMEQLFRYLEANRITSFLIRETPNPTHIGLGTITGGEAVSFLSDGIIVLYNVIFKSGERGRAVEILKLRGEDFKRRIVEMEIKGGKGVVIYPDKILTGDYRLT
jgi:circadian clock protein KaiC